LNNTTRELQLLKQLRSEQDRKSRILGRVRYFVERAKELGLERQTWDYYEVGIEEPVSFPEAREILSQTQNTGLYYFNPVTLNMRKDLGSKTGPKAQKHPSISADSEESKEGDIFLGIKGTFVLRQK
jgi:hypothetical protein